MKCLICLMDIQHHFIFVNCKCPYSYHRRCIDKWLSISPSCPICKKTFLTKKVKINIRNALFYDSIHQYNHYRYHVR